MRLAKPTIATAAVLGGLVWTERLQAVEPASVAGSIVGVVANAAGVPQMGASVSLYNRYERLVQKVLTTDRGGFGFDGLAPGSYSIRVSLVSFVPAVRDKIWIQPGMRSFLAIHLASVLSSIELVYMAPGQASLMSDDWKWVLRSSSATRPALRILPGERGSSKTETVAAFSRTRGLVKVSAGDGVSSSAGGSQPDLGTAFALATSVFGSNHLQFSGNVGLGSAAGAPSTAFSTRYTHGDPTAGNPEVALTMRQVFLPRRATAAVLGLAGENSAPALRTMSAAFADSTVIGDGIRIDYGATIESVQFLDRLNYLSPFARASYDAGELGLVEVGYSSGLPPPEMVEARSDERGELQQDLANLASMPRVSLRAGRPHVQRSENFEVGYRKKSRSRTYSVAAYRERVSNAALTAAAPAGMLPSTDLLPDLFSNSSVFNIGRYNSLGFTASVSQTVGGGMTLSAAYGNGNVLRTSGEQLSSNNPAELRNMIRSARSNWVMARVSATAPVSGTRFTASYQWTDTSAVTPSHRYLTQTIQPDAGLNVFVRQPLPSFTGMPGRFEATAEMRNMLAEGYLPITGADQRRMLLIHTPRSVRGGLSFIF